MRLWRIASAVFAYDSNRTNERKNGMEICIEKRVLDIASYMIETGATVRRAAAEFGVSKSTVHKDMTERLKHINKGMAKDVAAVLETNKEERHIRGGYATYLKYKALAQQRV